MSSVKRVQHDCRGAPCCSQVQKIEYRTAAYARSLGFADGASNIRDGKFNES